MNKFLLLHLGYKELDTHLYSAQHLMKKDQLRLLILKLYWIFASYASFCILKSESEFIASLKHFLIKISLYYYNSNL